MPSLAWRTITPSFTVSSKFSKGFLKNSLKKCLVASIGPVTSGEIKKFGKKIDIQAKKYTKKGLVMSIVKGTIN